MVRTTSIAGIQVPNYWMLVLHLLSIHPLRPRSETGEIKNRTCQEADWCPVFYVSVSSSFATLAAIRRASSRVSDLAAH